MEVVILGSGSSGNSCLVSAGGRRFLVDAGLSAKQLELRTMAAGIDPEEISAVFLTHEHQDHTVGLKTLLKHRPMTVFCNRATAQALGGASAYPQALFQIFETGAEFPLGSVSVRSFSVPHDASEPVGFRFEEGRACFGVLTDLGYATRLVTEALKGVTGLLLEANYDESLLQADTKRPWSVKQRIASRHGHLSNRDSAALLARLEAPSLELVVLGHLSRDCNSPELAVRTVEEALNGKRPLHVQCACQEGLPVPLPVS